VSRRRRAALALLVAPLLAACAAGRDAQTINTDTVNDAAGGDVGALQVRNVYLAAPETSLYGKGSDAPMYLTVANSSGAADTLTAVSSDAAASVNVLAGGTTSGGGASSAGPSGNGSGPTVSGGSAFPLAVPSGSALALRPESTHLVLQGLNRQLMPGQSVRVTFTFAGAGSTTLTVPVALRGDGAA